MGRLYLPPLQVGGLPFAVTRDLAWYGKLVRPCVPDMRLDWRSSSTRALGVNSVGFTEVISAEGRPRGPPIARMARTGEMSRTFACQRAVT
jgi:hypothetical protein